MTCLWFGSISSSFLLLLIPHDISEAHWWAHVLGVCSFPLWSSVSYTGVSRQHSSSSMSTQSCAQKNQSSSFEHSVRLEPTKCSFKQMSIMVLKTKYTQWIFNGLGGGLRTFIGWQSSQRHCFWNPTKAICLLLRHSHPSLCISTAGLWSYYVLVELGQDLPKGEFHLCICKSAFHIDICLGPGLWHQRCSTGFWPFSRLALIPLPIQT